MGLTLLHDFGGGAASAVLFHALLDSYLFGLAAALDRSGRWAAAVGSAYLLGFAAAWGFSMFVNQHLRRTGRAALSAVARGVRRPWEP